MQNDGQIRRDWDSTAQQVIGYPGLDGNQLYPRPGDMPAPVYSDMTGELEINGEHWRAGLMVLMRDIAQGITLGKRDIEQSGWRVIVQRLDRDMILSAGVVPMFTANFDTIQHAYSALDTLVRVFGSHYQFIGSDYGMHRLALAHQMIELVGREGQYTNEGDYHNMESMVDDIITFRGDSLFVDGFLFVVADA